MNVEISLILQREEEEGTNEKKKINPILLINACSFTSFFFFVNIFCQSPYTDRQTDRQTDSSSST